MQFALIANPENRRCQYFIDAVKSQGFAAPFVVSYLDIIHHRVDLEELLEKSDCLRIESPGENFEVSRQFIALGADHLNIGIAQHISAKAALKMPLIHGKIQFLKQWHLGFCIFLDALQEKIQQQAHLRVMNSIPDIQLMFDKIACHQHFTRHQITVPPAIYQVEGYADLRHQMKERGWNRVFIKPAYGSSASGVIAYRISGNKEQATTSTELVRTKEGYQLFNSLKIRQYKTQQDIRFIVDTLAQEGLLVEQWIPKASLDQGVFDLRMFVVGGKAQHSVIRQSSSPMTNLHLGNQRGDLKILKALIGDEKWGALCTLAEATARTLPNTLYTGLDIMLSSTLKKSYVLEANAFGDLLPNILVNGLDTYAATVNYLKQEHHYGNA